MIAVTGASGLLGACVLESAVERGLDAIGLCHQHVLRDPGLKIVSLDLTDHEATRKLLFELRPDAIVHCAAATNVDWCEEHPAETEAINVRATAALAETAALINARLIYISTDSVFDGVKGGYLENDEPAPRNVYAQSKLAGERETLRFHSSAGVCSAIVVRVNIYGWNAQDKESLAEWALGRIEKGESVPGFIDVFFSPLLVNDLAPVLFDLLQHDMSGLYHVTGSERISKFEFARKVAATFGFDPKLVTPCCIRDARLKAARPRDTSLNTEKIRLATGRAMPGVDAGLQAFKELRDRGYPQQIKSYLRVEKLV
jgi:dTDP-4-dehydrorhamnose reductase